ncbi:uncharacterized protein LOC121054187 [Oryza brachyantha]|uniref:uncharacterized protein LOC121054187 n=1 Tax=Oryza brachyantha TaxID=4533 RepID=UPI001ADA7A97|nr:uncharacterized protein LOC121054187 [Oryza brachyantha]
MVAQQAVRFLQAKYGFAIHDYNLQSLLSYWQITASAVDAALTASSHLSRFRARYAPMDLTCEGVLQQCIALCSLACAMSGHPSQRVQRARESRARRRASLGQGFLQAPVFADVSRTTSGLSTGHSIPSSSSPGFPTHALGSSTVLSGCGGSQSSPVGAVGASSLSAPNRKRTLLDVPRDAAATHREQRRLKRLGGHLGYLVQKILDGRSCSIPIIS